MALINHDKQHFFTSKEERCEAFSGESGAIRLTFLLLRVEMFGLIFCGGWPIAEFKLVLTAKAGTSTFSNSSPVTARYTFSKKLSSISESFSCNVLSVLQMMTFSEYSKADRWAHSRLSNCSSRECSWKSLTSCAMIHIASFPKLKKKQIYGKSGKINANFSDSFVWKS